MRKSAVPEGSNYNNTAAETNRWTTGADKTCYEAGWYSLEGRNDLQKGVLRSSRHHYLPNWSVMIPLQAASETNRLTSFGGLREEKT